MLVLPASDVRDLLSYGECADAMRSALRALAAGRAQQPLRTVIRLPGAPGLMAMMPSYLASGPAPADGPAAYGLKAICVTPANPAAGLDTHQGIVLLSDGQTGEPLAVVNASAVTEIRTAAVSVVATDLLARPGAADLAVIGTGVQGRAHVLALAQSRPLRRIRVAGRDPARAEAFAAGMRDRVSVPVTGCESVRDAVDGADIIVTATSSATAVLRRDWVSDGAHINAVGACLPGARELDGALVAAAALFADSARSLLSESGDYLLAVDEGLLGSGHLRAEIGEVLTGAAPGRARDGEITLFESLGLGVEDLAAAALAYRKAVAAQAGHRLEF
ncbi:MAG: ornithine cyclodeaminase family protein [Streptosporangiaceae bacterium]|jgi:ornithine cyclodeaminase